MCAAAAWHIPAGGKGVGASAERDALNSQEGPFRAALSGKPSDIPVMAILCTSTPEILFKDRLQYLYLLPNACTLLEDSPLCLLLFQHACILL